MLRFVPFNFSWSFADECRNPKNIRRHHGDEEDFVDAENVVPFDVVKNVDDDSSNVFDLEFVQDGQLDVKNEFVDKSASPNVETDVIVVVNSDNVLQRHPQEAFNRRIRKPKVSFFAADKMLGRFLFIVPQRVSLKIFHKSDDMTADRLTLGL